MAAATAAAPDSGQGSPDEGPDRGEEARERAYVRALLLAFFASQNRSLFAGKPRAPALSGTGAPPRPAARRHGALPACCVPPSVCLPACLRLPAPPAAKCFVEVVIEMYQQGASVDDVKVALSLAGLQHGGQLLSPLDEASRPCLGLLPCKGTAPVCSERIVHAYD